MGYRTSQQLAVQHAREFDVIGIDCAAGGFFTAIGSGDVMANYCMLFTHRETSNSVYHRFTNYASYPKGFEGPRFRGSEWVFR